MTAKEKRQKRKRDDFTRGNTHFGSPPALPIAPIDDVWKRVEELLPEEPTVAKPVTPKPESDGESNASTKRLKRTIRILDVVAAVAWAFGITKIYIGDIDRLLFSWVAPQAAGLLDLRVFAVLGLASLLLLLFKRWKLGVGLAYISFFPLVLVVWKIPKFFVERRKPALAVGALGVLISLMARAKVWVLALTIASISAAMILLTQDPILVGIGAGAMLVTLLWWFGTTAVDLFRAPSLLRAQEKVIDAVINWSLIDRIMTPKRPDRVTLGKWTKEEATAFRDSAGWAILTYRVLYFWAYLIDQFRKTPAVVVVNAIIIVGLTAQVILAFAFVNYGLYFIDPMQFSFVNPPDALTFLYYAAPGLNEIDALKPAGPWAIGLKLAEGAVLFAGIATIIGSTALAFRSVKADATAVSAIKRLKAKADDIEALANANFNMSLEKLEQQLIDASWGLFGIVVWVAAKTPTEWVDSINEKSK